MHAGARRSTPVAEPLDSELAGVARLDDAVGLDAELDVVTCTPATQARIGHLLVMLPQEIENLRRVGQIRLEMRAARNGSVNGVDAGSLGGRRHFL